MLDHLTMAWDLRWKFCLNQTSKSYVGNKDFSPVPTVPTRMQVCFTSVVVIYNILASSLIILFEINATQFTFRFQM